MARLRNLAITILRLSGATSIAAALRYHARREPQGSRCERGVLAWSLLACDRGQETVDVSLLLVPSLGCLESETSIHRGGQDPDPLRQAKRDGLPWRARPKDRRRCALGGRLLRVLPYAG